MSSWRFKLLYDGECPFCRREVDWLQRRDRSGHLEIEDISDWTFNPAEYGLTLNEVDRVLHGVMPDGTILRGMDAVREAYRTVGLGWLAAPTRMPLVRTACDCLYGLFARFRGPLGTLLGRGCPDGSCSVKSPRNQVYKRMTTRRRSPT